MKCSSRDFNDNRGGGAINLLKVVLRFSPHQNKINLKFPLWPGIQMNTSVLLLLIFCQLVSQLELIGQPFWGVLEPKQGEGRRFSQLWNRTFQYWFFFPLPTKRKKKEKKTKTQLCYHTTLIQLQTAVHPKAWVHCKCSSLMVFWHVLYLKTKYVFYFIFLTLNPWSAGCNPAFAHWPLG